MESSENSEYLDYTLMKVPNSSLLKLRRTKGGVTPKPLEGLFTGQNAAKKAIDTFVSSQTPRKTVNG